MDSAILAFFRPQKTPDHRFLDLVRVNRQPWNIVGDRDSSHSLGSYLTARYRRKKSAAQEPACCIDRFGFIARPQ